MKKQMVALLAGAMLMTGISTTAHALSITFNEGATTQTVTDGGAGDADGLANGIINLSNYTIGDFNITFVGGTSTLPSNPSKNTITINSVTINNTALATHTLNMKISDTGFVLNPVYPTTPNALATFSGSAYGASTTGQFNAYLDAGNALYGHGTALGVWGPASLSSGASGAITTYTTLTGNPFSLTEELMLTQAGGTSSTHLASLNVAPVPEPGTIALFGFGMLGLAIYGKRRMNRES